MYAIYILAVVVSAVGSGLLAAVYDNVWPENCHRQLGDGSRFVSASCSQKRKVKS